MPKTANETPRGAERLTTILGSLSHASESGLRLTDIMDLTGLGKATAHRLLNSLWDQGLVDHEPETGRYFVGMKLLSWAAAARNRFGLPKLAEAALARIARETEDTIYLVGRVQDDAICLDKQEGVFPIKVLTLSVGDLRPLGIGAGSLAILAALPDAEINRIMAHHAAERALYAFSDEKLRGMIAETRRCGHSYNDTHIFSDMADVAGMAAVAVAVKRPDGRPVAALHLTAITERLSEPRRSQVTQMLQAECTRLETEIRPALDGPMMQARA